MPNPSRFGNEIPEENDLDSLLLVHNPRFLKLLEDARRRVQVTSGVPLSEFRRQVDDLDE